jgi:CheY-like chemotaxis protein
MCKDHKPKMTVLVAEDNPDTMGLLRQFLSRGGYETIEASNGMEAINLAINKKPDLIILDLSMPLVDGITAAREIRKDPVTKKIPILFTTAHGIRGINLFLESDLVADPALIDYLPKPFTSVELNESIERLLCAHQDE